MASRRRIKDILDSDDELPITYKDINVTPAYQDDNRFSTRAIYKLIRSDSDSSVSSSEMSFVQDENSEEENELTKNKENKQCFLKEGVLSRKDAYCIKVFGTVYHDETLLWFINFTILKDMQSNYNFLISCLASDDENFKSNCDNFNKENKDCDKKIVFEYKEV